MLNQTFCHIPGIGLKTERRLWAAGVRSWKDWQDPPPFALANSTARTIPGFLDACAEALEAGRASFFTSCLTGGEDWRIFPHFRTRTAFIDIETTGLGADALITTIALYDGKTVRTYVAGRNLDDFVSDIFLYQVLVSYNGKGFDVPFLERHFKIQLDQAHIDLRYVLARLGLKGGLKGCEKQLGIDRGTLTGVDGFFAVLLWREYERSGNEKAIETLLAYNIEDTVNLEKLLVEAYNRNIAATPFARELAIPAPEPVCIPYRADEECVERLLAINGATR